MKSSANVLIPDQVAVAPCDPPAAWIGGKRHLARRICAILAATPHAAYVEPFVGAGGVFLRRTLRPNVEVINDVSGDVVTLFRVLQRFPEALLAELRWRPAMRAEFDRMKGLDPAQMLDIERAARFLYLQTLAYGGKVTGRSFGIDTRGGHDFDLKRIRPRLMRLHERLAGVIIENLDWRDLIDRYDRDTTLLYLDPPYWGSEDDYGPGVFGRADFAALADRLREGRSRFLFSINDRPEIRELFAWADMEAVTTTYSIAGGDKAQAAAELLIGKGVDLVPAAGQARLL